MDEIPENLNELDYNYILKQVLKNKDSILNGKFNLKNLTRVKKERTIGELKLMVEYYINRQDKASEVLQTFIEDKVFKNKTIKKEGECKSIYYAWEDTYYKVTFSYNDRFKCYSISERSVSDMNRGQTLDFLTLHEDYFRLGEEYIILHDKTRTILLSICNRAFDYKLNYLLNDYFKDGEIPKSFTIDINGIKYTTKCNDLYTYNRSFDILSELDLKTTIKL